MDHFFEGQSAVWEDLGDGVSRTIIGHTPELFTMAVRFRKGGIGVQHAHDVHNQISYVAAGSFKATIGGVDKILKTGDAFIAPKFVTHGVVALEDGSMLIDSFSPRRDDLAFPKG